MLSNSEAASLGLLLTYAMDMYEADLASLAPTPDPRLTNWKIVGYLTAVDSIFRQSKTIDVGGTVYYGFVAQLIGKPNVFVAVVRGTNGILEWIEDAEFISMPHPAGGQVERGFYGVYGSMQYRPIGGDILPAARGIANAVGLGSLTVLGHSLGSALATYLTFDLAHESKLGARVQGCFFASPRTGNTEFVRVFDQRVQTYQLFNYELDVVPRVPRGSGYADLPRVVWIEGDNSQAKIRFDLGCHHHIVCYCSMLDFRLQDWAQMPVLDRSCTSCIKGPTPLAAVIKALAP